MKHVYFPEEMINKMPCEIIFVTECISFNNKFIFPDEIITTTDYYMSYKIKKYKK